MWKIDVMIDFLFSMNSDESIFEQIESLQINSKDYGIENNGKYGEKQGWL